MTVVYFTDGDMQTYDSVTVKVSGWVFCKASEEDALEAFPPHMVVSMKDPDRSESRRGEGISHQSPHGRV